MWQELGKLHILDYNGIIKKQLLGELKNWISLFIHMTKLKCLTHYAWFQPVLDC